MVQYMLANILWYKGTLKTQYGLVHKFARNKQFYKHMIILKNVNNCDITYKTFLFFLLFFFFSTNTGFVGMKAVVSSSFSKDIPDDWRPTIWISYWLGWGNGDEDIQHETKQQKNKIKIKKRKARKEFKKKRKKKTTDTKTNTLEQKQKSKWFTMGGHKRQDQKSGKYPLTCHPLAVNSL